MFWEFNQSNPNLNRINKWKNFNADVASCVFQRWTLAVERMSMLRWHIRPSLIWVIRSHLSTIRLPEIWSDWWGLVTETFCQGLSFNTVMKSIIMWPVHAATFGCKRQQCPAAKTERPGCGLWRPSVVSLQCHRRTTAAAPRLYACSWVMETRGWFMEPTAQKSLRTWQGTSKETAAGVWWGNQSSSSSRLDSTAAVHEHNHSL